jgi:hypothetical protein
MTRKNWYAVRWSQPTTKGTMTAKVQATSPEEAVTKLRAEFAAMAKKSYHAHIAKGRRVYSTGVVEIADPRVYLPGFADAMSKAGL